MKIHNDITCPKYLEPVVPDNRGRCSRCGAQLLPGFNNLRNEYDKRTMRLVIQLLLLLAGFVIAYALGYWFTRIELLRQNEYNAHVCAVNGYAPDCKTLLKGGK
jgi:hypothetical protein